MSQFIKNRIGELKTISKISVLVAALAFLPGCLNGESMVPQATETPEPTQVAVPVVDDNKEKGNTKDDTIVSPTPVPENTATPTPTPTEIPHIDASEMFSEAYFAIIKERLQTYKDDTVGDSLIKSQFAKYETPYNADDYRNYEIDGDTLVFHFEENALTGADHPAFDYKCEMSEAINFMHYNPDGTGRYAPTIRELDPNAKMIALTFDDGPNPVVEEKILELFDKYNAKTTFFLLGNKCDGEDDREIIKKMLEAGHDVESHTYSHVYFNKPDWDREEIWTEQNKANLVLAEIMGHAPEYVRLPGGCSIDYLKNLPMPRIGWSWGALDWENRSLKSGESRNDMLKRKVKETYENVTEHASDGFIILMHSTYPEAPEATELILKDLTDRGFICVTLSELFYYKGVTPENGVSYGIVRKQ
ncbi:MAG: polysaccharide deacetylase family protein [Lachnospiraceae bacterium]|nr:polysaccharide deacetylase family protein [Lachnospiraceae bacterium]